MRSDLKTSGPVWTKKVYARLKSVLSFNYHAFNVIIYLQSNEGLMKRIAINLLFLLAALLLSYAFFHLALNNGFWHGDDFISLEHSLKMMEETRSAFDSQPPYKFQPIAYAIYFALFKLFGFSPKGYFLFNILIHGLNSFLVYTLVNALLKDRAVALLSGLLFVFTVGSYGKSIMIMSGMEDLIITTLTLLTMIFYFKNELEHEGRLFTPWFALAIVFFIASMLTRSTSFAILGTFLAFHYFFHESSRKGILSPNFIILFAITVAALIVKTSVFNYHPHFYDQYPGAVKVFYYTVKNVISYLVRMIFPIHTSHLVIQAGPAVRFIYRFATEIRILIALTVISYSFFGFIFGNRTIRFFIAWTYIMVIPFAFFQFPRDWLNIRHLYLVSVGFVMIISAGAIYCSRLISHQRWRRFVPLIVPIFFVFLARFIVTQLDKSYELKAQSSRTVEYKKTVVERFPDRVALRNGELVLLPKRGS